VTAPFLRTLRWSRLCLVQNKSPCPMRIFFKP
jgi:hypothetical protein